MLPSYFRENDARLQWRQPWAIVRVRWPSAYIVFALSKTCLEAFIVDNGTHWRNGRAVNYDSALLTRRHVHFWQIPSLCCKIADFLWDFGLVADIIYIVVEYFSRTWNTMDFKMNLFKFIKFSAIDVTGNAVVCRGCDVINNNVIDQCEESTVIDNKFRIEFPSTVTGFLRLSLPQCGFI